MKSSVGSPYPWFFRRTLTHSLCVCMCFQTLGQGYGLALDVGSVVHQNHIQAGPVTEYQEDIDWTQNYYQGEIAINGRRTLAEANLTCRDISAFGASIFKLPNSLVRFVEQLRREKERENGIVQKTHNYNFLGSTQQPNSHREWALTFARDHFADNDVLQLIKDFYPNHTSYGAWDHTGEEHVRERFETHVFDITYYETLVQSNFTLCPGGHKNWSVRFFEAMLAGSIPVIKSLKEDFHTMTQKVGYKFFFTDEVVNMKMSSAELKSIADANLKLIRKYQTWIDGDHVPPALAEWNKPFVPSNGDFDYYQPRSRQLHCQNTTI